MTRRFGTRMAVAMILAAGLGAALAPPRVLWADPPAQDPMVLYALPNSSELMPGMNTPGTGLARFVLSADHKQLFYEVRVANLTSDPISMGLHQAPRGQMGDEVMSLAVPVRGQAVGYVNLTPQTADALVKQGLYLEISTKVCPAGEIRGQVIAAP